jgi:hypothetical protein
MNEQVPKTTIAGPSLEQYIETRFTLLAEYFKDKLGAQDAAVLAFSESVKLAAIALKNAQDAQSAAADLRYQQRFEAQSDALAAAFLSQQNALQTALTVAEKAVQAALAAAKEAVSKAELAADKRFEALNELRQMLNDTLANLFTRPEAVQRFDSMAEKNDITNTRITGMEARLNTLAGEATGGRQNKDDARGTWAMAIAVLAVLINLAGFAFLVLRSTPAVK